MIIDATFWVAVSFFIFFGVLIYLKIPQKINSSLASQIADIKKELDETEKLKIEAKNLLSDYESKIDKSKKETQVIIKHLEKMKEQKKLSSVGIITPFSDQQKYLTTQISKHPDRDYFFEKLKLKMISLTGDNLS